jgi:hypothetical protein
MEVAYNVISILMTNLSLAVLLYGAWLSVRFRHDAYEGIGTHTQDPASHAALQQEYPIQPPGRPSPTRGGEDRRIARTWPAQRSFWGLGQRLR